MHFTCIKETCLYVQSLAATRHFYHDLLQLQVISQVEGRHIFFRAGTSVLLCFIANTTLAETELPPHGATGKIHFALEVEPAMYNDVLVTIRQKNIAITHQHVWPTGARSFYFDDPDGHVVEVAEKGLWEEY